MLVSRSFVVAGVSLGLLFSVVACDDRSAERSSGRTAEAVDPEAKRRFAFRYEVEVPAIGAGEGPVDVFVPLPVESAQQRVIEFAVQASLSGQVERDPVYGNRFFRGRVERSEGEPIAVVVDAMIERRSPGADEPAPRDDAESLARFLSANERVVVGHEMLEPILEEIRGQAGSTDKATLARAIYDWVVDNVEYKKVGTGWGNGDTFWACNERYGNCTDFHSLLISLARTEGIPARFEMGFPVPTDAPAGKVAGYHCWVEVYLEGEGWVPLDASEASKHPEQREAFFGVPRNDRVHMSTGRDLRLGAEHRDAPLNYFVYPYVEVGGARYEGPIERTFSYREVEAG